jgi:hypothetical protein
MMQNTNCYTANNKFDSILQYCGCNGSPSYRKASGSLRVDREPRTEKLLSFLPFLYKIDRNGLNIVQILQNVAGKLRDRTITDSSIKATPNIEAKTDTHNGRWSM